MSIDLRLHNTFFVSKEIFLDPKVPRRARAVYVTLCFLTSLSQKIANKITLEFIAKASGYNKQIARQAIKELDQLGFIVRDKRNKYIGIAK